MTSHENVRHVRAQGELRYHLIEEPCITEKLSTQGGISVI